MDRQALEEHFETATQFRTPSENSSVGIHAGSGASDTTVLSTVVFPIWPAEWDMKFLTELIFHTNSQIKGKLSMIVDPGAWISMFGKNLARSLAGACATAGHRFQQPKLNNPINISGVGNGTNQIKYNFDGPIAIAQLFNLTAGIVDTPGEGLPGLLGMDVLRSRRAIMDIGNKRLIFPGAGGYEIKLAPGFTRIPLSRAPSGHLCIPTDKFTSSPSSGLPKQEFTLHSRVE